MLAAPSGGEQMVVPSIAVPSASVSGGVPALAAAFRQRISAVQSLLLHSMNPNALSNSADVQAVADRLNDAEESVRALQQWVATEQRSLRLVTEQLLPAFRAQNAQLRAVASALPKHLPGAQHHPNALKALADITNRQPPAPAVAGAGASASACGGARAITAPPTAVKAPHKTPAKSVAAVASGAENAAPAAAAAAAPAPASSGAGGALVLPDVPYVSATEWDRVPSYARGRLTQSAVNEAIDELRAVLKAKYTLLSANPSKIAGSFALLQHYKKVRDEESIALSACPELKGVKWLAADDLITSANEKLKAEAQKRNAGSGVLAVLRHCNRLKLHTANNTTRYIVCA